MEDKSMRQFGFGVESYTAAKELLIEIYEKYINHKHKEFTAVVVDTMENGIIVNRVVNVYDSYMSAVALINYNEQLKQTNTKVYIFDYVHYVQVKYSLHETTGYSSFPCCELNNYIANDYSGNRFGLLHFAKELYNTGATLNLFF